MLLSGGLSAILVNDVVCLALTPLVLHLTRRLGLDPRLTAMAWLGMHNYTYLWMKRDGALSAREVASRFADIFIRGIASQPTAG